MDAQQRKITAAVAAVYAYIRNQEDAASLNAMAVGQAPIPPAGEPAPPPTPPSPWGVSGRLDQMHLRGMMQLKAFHGWRSR